MIEAPAPPVQIKSLAQTAGKVSCIHRRRARGKQPALSRLGAEYGAAVRNMLPVSDDHVIISGMAVGFVNKQAPVNGLTTERDRMSEFVIRHG